MLTVVETPPFLYALAAQIRRWCEQERAVDPYCRPFYPDDRYVDRRYRQHADDTYDVLVAEWERSKVRLREQRLLDDRRHERERERLRLVRQERGSKLERLTLTERLQRVLAHAELVSYGKSGSVEQHVGGNAQHPSRILEARSTFGAKLPLLDQVRARLENEIRRAEELVERERLRSLPEDNREPREERLLRMAGLSPAQVILQDPEQGTVSQVRARRRSLGVDEETGGRRAA